MKIAIASVADDNFQPGFEALIKSLGRYNDISDMDVIRLGAMTKYDDAPAMADKWRTAMSVFECFNMPEYDRVVYLDSDVICCGPTPLLFSDELNDYDVASAPNHSQLRAYEEVPKHIPAKWKELAWAQIRYRRPLHNSGVLVINRSAMDENNPQRLVDILESGECCKIADQGAINELMHRMEYKLYTLPEKYNFLRSYLARFPEYNDDLRLIHYVGNPKPWVGDKDEIGGLDHVWHEEA